MRYSPRNIEIAFGHAGLTHYGGVLFVGEFIRMLQLRRFLTRHLRYPRRNQDYQLPQMILSLVYAIILGLDRLETGIAVTFQWHLSVFDRPSELPESTKLAAISVAGYTRFSRTTP